MDISKFVDLEIAQTEHLKFLRLHNENPNGPMVWLMKKLIEKFEVQSKVLHDEILTTADGRYRVAGRHKHQRPKFSYQQASEGLTDYLEGTWGRCSAEVARAAGISVQGKRP